MIRTSITPTNNNCLITIPTNYIGKELEVFIYAKDELITDNVYKKSMEDFKGTLSDTTANAMRKEVIDSRNSWDDRMLNQL